MGFAQHFAVLAFAAMAAGPPAGQAEGGLLRWFVTLDGADTVTGKVRAYRVYDSSAPLRLAVQVANESQTTAVVDVNRFVAALDVHLEGGGMTPLEAELDDVQRSGFPPRPGRPLTPIRLLPNGSLTVRLLLRGEGGWPLEPGEYDIALNLARASATIEDGNRSVWPRQSMAATTLSLTIAPPRNSVERVSMLAFKAHNALADKDLLAAEGLLLRALEEGPNLSLSCALGNLYVVQGRYREAIDTYEQADAGFGVRDPQLLALAYVGMGAEEAAVRALRAGGWSEARIKIEMQLLRDIIARRAGSLQ